MVVLRQSNGESSVGGNQPCWNLEQRSLCSRSEISATTTSLVTATLFSLMVAMGIACNATIQARI